MKGKKIGDLGPEFAERADLGLGQLSSELWRIVQGTVVLSHNAVRNTYVTYLQSPPKIASPSPLEPRHVRRLRNRQRAAAERGRKRARARMIFLDAPPPLAGF